MRTLRIIEGRAYPSQIMLRKMLRKTRKKIFRILIAGTLAPGHILLVEVLKEPVLSNLLCPHCVQVYFIATEKTL